MKGCKNPLVIWVLLALGLCVALRAGIEQHFGGLAETRKFFYAQNPDLQNISPEFIKKMNSDRIFGTFPYANALAGSILFLLPLTLALVWQFTVKFSTGLRCLMISAFGAIGLACLYWSGSKSGWLLAVVLGVLALLHSPLSRKGKQALVCTLVVVGLVGFTIKNLHFFQKGSTSVVARFDYWKAALQTVKERPFLGSGPGTFFRQYEKLKSPESEMTRLCHNDYLQQASDSGLPGFVAYLGFVVTSLWFFYRRVLHNSKPLDLLKRKRFPQNPYCSATNARASMIPCS